jgi:hypothetical protein
LTKLDADTLVRLRREHGSLTRAASALGVDRTAVFRAWRAEGLPTIGKDGLTDDERASKTKVGVTFETDADGEIATLTATGDVREVALGDVDSLLRDRGLDPAEWDVVSLTVNEWDGPVSGGGTQKLRQLKASLRPRRILATLLRPAELPPIGLLASPRPVRTDAARLGVVTGCWQYPYADETFEGLFEEWLRIVRPDFGIDLGDGMDFPTISRHRDNPSHAATPQACIDAYGLALYRRRLASPDTAWKILLGNHDIRVLTEQLQRAERLAGLRPAVFPSDDVEPEPLYSPRRILRLDELEVEAVLPPGGDYRFAEVEITPELLAIHGEKTDARGAALSEVTKYRASVLMAHTHRQRLYSKRLPRGTSGAVEAIGVEVGCGCRIDGGLGYAVRPDWTNGAATVSLDADGFFSVDFIRYADGVLRWRDVTIRAG